MMEHVLLLYINSSVYTEINWLFPSTRALAFILKFKFKFTLLRWPGGNPKGTKTSHVGVGGC